jgi:hypothetical protein
VQAGVSEHRIVIVSAANETGALSLVDSRKRLDESKAAAVAANETMFEKIINLDPEDDEATVEDRIERAMAIEKAEAEADKAWLVYERCLIRYGWEVVQARKAGIVE